MRSLKRTIWIALLLVAILAIGAFAERASVGPVSMKKVNGAMQTLSTNSQEMTMDDVIRGRAAKSALGGGEDIATATVIPALPIIDSGTTTGFANDYDVECPTASTAPDAVYSYTPTIGQRVHITTCDASYWTKIYVYEDSDTGVYQYNSEDVCNQYSDSCADPFHAALFDIGLTGGKTYYIVIDGFNGASGDYVLEMEARPPTDTMMVHPALADNGSGTLVWGFENQEYDDLLYWQNSLDDGDNWSYAVYWTGAFSYASMGYFDNDTAFYGTMLPYGDYVSGAPNILMDLPNGNDITTISFSYWDWSSYGWHDMKMVGMAVDNNREDWAWGIQSMIHSTTYTTVPMVDAPHLFYPTAADGWATISWYEDFDNCISTNCAIDAVTHYSYAIYDHQNAATHGWELFCRQDDASDWDDTLFSGGYTYDMGDGTDLQYPAVAAHNAQVVIVAENYDPAAPADKDLVCFHTDAATMGSLVNNVVVGSSDAERFPEIISFDDTLFLLTYVSTGQLYATTTSDAGATWAQPTVISEVGDYVVSEYRGVDIAESDGFGCKIMYEYYPHLTRGDSSIFIRMITHTVVPYPDGDGDGTPDHLDNCPTVYNDDQLNSDADSFGDACDNCPTTDNEDQLDGDVDTVGDACDNCLTTPNPTQDNSDSDNWGDACDNCPQVDNQTQANSDTDIHGDACDNCLTTDNDDQQNSDADTFGDACDNCPDSTSQDQTNSDGDSHGDICDNCPLDDNEDQADQDQDGIGDVCDAICGDVNGDELVNIFDITYLIEFLYNSGPPPANDWASDVNGDTLINIFDITYIIEFLYRDGPAPACI